MKTTLLLLATTLGLSVANAQYSNNFDGGTTSLNGSCWNLFQVNHTEDGQYPPINGTGSVYTNPPTGGFREIATPFLNMNSTSLTVSFSYKITSKIAGNATRVIEIGIKDVSGDFIVLQTITLDKTTPISVQYYSNTLTLPSTGTYRLTLRIHGATGDGNSRLLLDDLYASASPYYTGGGCNSAPIAVNDDFYGTTGMPIAGNVMANDNDPNGESMTSAIVVTSPDGIVIMNTSGSFSFTPNPGFVGATTTFTYQLVDAGFDPFLSNIATVTLHFSTAAPLPIQVVSFTAMLNGTGKVDLRWTTSSEVNSSHFVIERSVDGRTYEDAGMVFAAGNSTTNQYYTFTDNIASVTKTIIYYRLRQVELDSKMDFSATRIIRTSKETSTATILTYPNPAVSEVRITIPQNWQGKQVNYEIVNVSGQTVKRTTVGNSSQTEVIALNSLNSGYYLVKVSCNGETAQQKIIKQ